MKSLSKTKLIQSNRDLKNLLELILVCARDGQLDHIFKITKNTHDTHRENEKWVTTTKQSHLTISELDEIIKKSRTGMIEGLDLIYQRLGDYNKLLQDKKISDEKYLRKETSSEKIQKIEDDLISQNSNYDENGPSYAAKEKIILEENAKAKEIAEAPMKEHKRLQEDDDMLLFYSLGMSNKRVQDIIDRLRTKKDNPLWEFEYNFYRNNFPNHAAWGKLNAD